MNATLLHILLLKLKQVYKNVQILFRSTCFSELDNDLINVIIIILLILDSIKIITVGYRLDSINHTKPERFQTKQ